MSITKKPSLYQEVSTWLPRTSGLWIVKVPSVARTGSSVPGECHSASWTGLAGSLVSKIRMKPHPSNTAAASAVTGGVAPASVSPVLRWTKKPGIVTAVPITEGAPCRTGLSPPMSTKPSPPAGVLKTITPTAPW